MFLLYRERFRVTIQSEININSLQIINTSKQVLSLIISFLFQKIKMDRNTEILDSSATKSSLLETGSRDGSDHPMIVISSGDNVGKFNRSGK